LNWNELITFLTNYTIILKFQILGQNYLIERRIK